MRNKMTEKPKFKHEDCFICNKEKFTYLGIRDLSNQLRWVKTLCFFCLGKGYIKVKKEQ